jgi:hypothetical protein
VRPRVRELRVEGLSGADAAELEKKAKLKVGDRYDLLSDGPRRSRREAGGRGPGRHRVPGRTGPPRRGGVGGGGPGAQAAEAFRRDVGRLPVARGDRGPAGSRSPERAAGPTLLPGHGLGGGGGIRDRRPGRVRSEARPTGPGSGPGVRGQRLAPRRVAGRGAPAAEGGRVLRPDRARRGEPPRHRPAHRRGPGRLPLADGRSTPGELRSRDRPAAGDPPDRRGRARGSRQPRPPRGGVEPRRGLDPGAAAPGRRAVPDRCVRERPRHPGVLVPRPGLSGSAPGRDPRPGPGGNGRPLRGGHRSPAPGRRDPAGPGGDRPLERGGWRGHSGPGRLDPTRGPGREPRPPLGDAGLPLRRHPGGDHRRRRGPRPGRGSRRAAGPQRGVQGPIRDRPQP